MKIIHPFILLGCIAVCGLSAFGQTNAGDLVDVLSVDSTFVLDIRYATEKNFTRTVLYPASRAKLRRVAAESLAAVQRELREMNLGIKIYDGYRPLSIQKKLWAIVPNDTFVANPAKGSKHNRGAAVDVTIVDASGGEIEMPTGYDDFSDKAAHTSMECSNTAKKNRSLLKEVMMRHGFLPIRSEWWHYDFQGWEQFSIMDEPL